MEWIKSILEKHRKEDGTVDLEKAMAEINAEFPKNAVPKNEYNDKAKQLKEANDTITQLKQNNQNNEDLQQKIKDYETKIQNLEKEALETKKIFALKEALTKAGAKDVDYMLFKLGDVEMDKDGNIKDLDNKVKELKESNPSFFEGDANQQQQQHQQQPGAPGYQVIDNKLDKGKPSDPVAKAQADFEAALGLKSE